MTIPDLDVEQVSYSSSDPALHYLSANKWRDKDSQWLEVSSYKRYDDYRITSTLDCRGDLYDGVWPDQDIVCNSLLKTHNFSCKIIIQVNGKSYSRWGSEARVFSYCGNDMFTVPEEQFDEIVTMSAEQKKVIMGVPKNAKGKGYENKISAMERRVVLLRTLLEQCEYDAFFDNMFFLLRHFNIWLFDPAKKEMLIAILCAIFSKTFEASNELESIFGGEKVLELCSSHST